MTNIIHERLPRLTKLLYGISDFSFTDAAILLLAGIAFAAFYPLTRASHAQTRAEIARRNEPGSWLLVSVGQFDNPVI